MTLRRVRCVPGRAERAPSGGLTTPRQPPQRAIERQRGGNHGCDPTVKTIVKTYDKKRLKIQDFVRTSLDRIDII